MNSNKQHPVICFRRWSRKGYAVFASLNKVVKIGVVTFCCTLVQQKYQPIFAQKDSTRISKDVKIKEVVISENRQMLGSGQAYAIRVMDQKEILASPVRSMDDLLEQVTGVDVRQRGTDGIQADISLRGGSFDQVMILLNGVNITDPQTGHYNLDIPVDLQQIKRIEVLQGAGSRIFGPNAFSGVINIVTIPDSEEPSKQGFVNIEAGGFGYQNLSTSGFRQKNNWKMGGSFSGKKSDGYTKNTDYEQFNCNLLGAIDAHSIGNLTLQMGYQQKSFGANSFYSFSYPNQYEHTKTLFSALNWEKTIGKTNWQAQLYERQHHDQFELFRNMENAASWYTGYNYHQTDVTGGNLTANIFGKFDKKTVGMDIRNEHIFSNVLGESMRENVTDFLDKNAIFNKEKNRTNHRIFFDETLFTGPYSLSAGISGNYNSDFGSYLYSGWDAGYEITPSSRAYITVNQAMRLPTFTDLYYQSATQISNPNLKPEESTTYELGFKYSLQELKVSASTYYRSGKNVIDWVKMPDSTKWESKNLTEVHAFGGNITAEYHFADHILKNIRIAYAYLYLDKMAEDFDSKYALDYLKHKISFHLEHQVFHGRRLGSIDGVWNLCFQDRAGNYTDFVTKRTTAYKPYSLCDFRMQWSKKKVSIYADINNFFNTRYADFGGLTQPGRTYRTGIKINL